jgi:hypothetical protein
LIKVSALVILFLSWWLLPDAPCWGQRIWLPLKAPFSSSVNVTSMGNSQRVFSMQNCSSETKQLHCWDDA